MQPSSLVFVLIVAVWAAFFVQHLVRRRERIATARGMDRFGEAVRILEMRHGSTAPTGTARHRSSASSPLAARPAARSAGAPLTSSVTAEVPMAEPTPQVTRQPLAATAPTSAASTSAAPPYRRPSPLLRKLRGIAFLVTLVSIPVTIILTVAVVLLPISILISVVAFAACVVWLRTSAVKERAARQARRRAARARQQGDLRQGTVHQDSVSQDNLAQGSDRGFAAEQPSRATATEPAATQEGQTPGRAAVSRTAAVGSRAPVEVSSAATSTDAEVATSSTWSPRPVPRPTYQLKASVRRALPEPAATTEPGPAAPTAAADEIFDQTQRRASGH